MITGDHAGTAAAIAAQVGVGERVPVVAGTDLDRLDDAALRRTVQQADVFARASPEHKLRLVQALQAAGEVVAMTGDGVNDAPALRRADIGVAMGQKGTEVAREAAEMVLVDDNFSSIVSAIEEGRTVYDNLRKAILFLLPTSVGEAMILIAAIAMGMVLPITPVQILWVNMITAVTLGLALAFEPTEPGVMRRPPRNPRDSLLSGFFVWRVLFVSVVMVAGTFGLFLREVTGGAPVAHARTVAVNTLAMFELFYLFSARYLLAPVLNRQGLTGNPYVLWLAALLLLFQFAFTYLVPMQRLFGTVAITGWDWMRIVLVAISVMLLVEAEKWVVRRRRR
jgi:magnesium-transporting ATPase (P-type)